MLKRAAQAIAIVVAVAIGGFLVLIFTGPQIDLSQRTGIGAELCRQDPRSCTGDPIHVPNAEEREACKKDVVCRGDVSR